jgi:hypothetical protein
MISLTVLSLIILIGSQFQIIEEFIEVSAKDIVVSSFQEKAFTFTRIALKSFDKFFEVLQINCRFFI